jgi:two-component system sensor histidine kinase PilS (NtrC family)
MAIALSEMDRLNETLTDFLSFARPGEPEHMAFDLHKALSETLELLRNRDDCSVEIRAEFRGAMEVHADQRRINEVFWNLGVNALEAMAEGGILSVETFESDGMVHVLFSDTGPGIPEADLERVFFPFYTTKRTGTGLGLSTSFRTIEEHGGRIKVDSIVDGGSVFTVIIPRDHER